MKVDDNTRYFRLGGAARAIAKRDYDREQTTLDDIQVFCTELGVKGFYATSSIGSAWRVIGFSIPETIPDGWKVSRDRLVPHLKATKAQMARLSANPYVDLHKLAAVAFGHDVTMVIGGPHSSGHGVSFRCAAVSKLGEQFYYSVPKMQKGPNDKNTRPDCFTEIKPSEFMRMCERQAQYCKTRKGGAK